MKPIAFLACLFIVAVMFYVSGGSDMLGLGDTTELPETMTPPNATFMGNSETNPFASEPPAKN